VFFHVLALAAIYTLSLHDALPISVEKLTLFCMLPQNDPSYTPSQLTATMAPPQMPTTLKISVSNGSEMKPAHRRGATMYLSGSTPIISKLDSCSVDFMLPISAASADPARPANSSAVTTGPSSRSRVRATVCPTACSEP